VPKLRVCYQVANHDPTVVIGVKIALEHSDDEIDAEELDGGDGGDGGDGALVVYNPNKNPPTHQKKLNTFLLEPSSLTDAIDTAVDKRSVHMNLFAHIVTYINCRGYKEETQTVSSL